MSTPSLKPEVEYYIANQKKLAARYAGKYLVIKGQKVIAVYEREMVAVKQSEKEHALGTVLVQKADAATDSYSQSYHSRVI